MAMKQIVVPDIGDFSDVAVIDVYIKEVDTIALDDPVIALESAKAVTDIPSPFAGVIKSVHIKEGDLVSKDSLLADIEVEEEQQSSTEAPPKEEPANEQPEETEESKPEQEPEPEADSKQEPRSEERRVGNKH